VRVVLAHEARQEFEAAVRYYNRQVLGLGTEMRAEVRAALRRVIAWPLACPIERGDIRRLILSRFPYKLLYAVEADHIYLIAVAHLHRMPDYWVDRNSAP